MARADRGQVPFGNALLYGAMALVVVGGAGLVLATGGFSQSLDLANATGGEEAGPAVTVRSAAADARLGAAPAYGRVTVLVDVRAGSAPIPVSNLSARWVGVDGTYDLAPARLNRTDRDGHFGVASFADPDDSFPTLNAGDRAVLVFDLGPGSNATADDPGGRTGPGATYFGDALAAGHGATLRVGLGAGVVETVALRAPAAGDREAVGLLTGGRAGPADGSQPAGAAG